MSKQSCLCQPCRMCEFKALSGGCTLIKTKGMSLSDGSKLQAKQPQTNPQQWFLTQDEITQYRGGVPRTDLAAFSSNNHVAVFVATDKFFRSVSRDVERVGADDHVLLTAWTIDQTVPFEPKTDPIGATTSFQSLFSRAVARGASLYGLLWANSDEHQRNTQARDFMNSFPVMKNGENAQLLFDDRVPFEASHSQRTLVLEHHGNADDDVEESDGAELVAYVVSHDQSSLRKRAGIEEHYKDWIDANVRIAGPAAKDMAANFVGRWNSKTPPISSAEAPIPLSATWPDVANTLGPHHVQIVRTFSPKYQRYIEFASEGETSLLQARVKAVRNANNFIYIEVEAFEVVPALLDKLLKVLPRLQRLIAVAQRPDSSSSRKLLFDMIAPMQKLFPSKLQIYTLKGNHNVHLNSKLVIVDDMFLSISSASWRQRSMDAGSAISVNVVDNELMATSEGTIGAKIARDFRVRKFLELTGRTDYEALSARTFIEAADQLDAAVGDSASVIDALKVEEEQFVVEDLLTC